MRVVVTGGAGFIGSHIVEHFQGIADVRVLDNLRSGHLRNLEGFRYDFIRGSLLDPQALKRAVEGADYVFHLAAGVSVPESMRDPGMYNEINTAGTLAVLEAAAHAGAKKFIFSSSAAVYGDSPSLPKVETMPPEPRSPYAMTKLDGEFYCRLFEEQGRLPTVCLRYFNVFGPRQDPESQYAPVIARFVRQCLRNEELTIFGDGEQKRDFVYVKDVVAANVFFATESTVTGTFNVAEGEAMSVNELAQLIRTLTGSKSPVAHANERPGDVRDSVASVDKLRKAGFSLASNRVDGLRQTVDFFRKRMG